MCIRISISTTNMIENKTHSSFAGSCIPLCVSNNSYLLNSSCFVLLLKPDKKIYFFNSFLGNTLTFHSNEFFSHQCRKTSSMKKCSCLPSPECYIYFWRKQHQLVDPATIFSPNLLLSIVYLLHHPNPWLSLSHKQLIQTSLNFLRTSPLSNVLYHCRGLKLLHATCVCKLYTPMPLSLTWCQINYEYFFPKLIRTVFTRSFWPTRILPPALHRNLRKELLHYYFCFFTSQLFPQSNSACFVESIIPLKLLIPTLPTISLEINPSESFQSSDYKVFSKNVRQ